MVGADDWPGVERVARLEEQLDLLDRLLRGETIEAHEGYYQTAGAVVERPLQAPRPPFVVAADGPRLLDLAARRGDAWNTLGGQPMRGEGASPVSLDDAIEATRARSALLDDACDRIGRARSSLRRALLAYRVDPRLFHSADAFSDYVGRYREAGIDEFVFYWPFDPATFRRVPTYERALERIAAETIPALRAGSAAAA